LEFELKQHPPECEVAVPSTRRRFVDAACVERSVLSIYRPYIVYILPIYCIYTAYILYIYIVYILCMYCLFTTEAINILLFS
jgi:hypothetical protein